MKLVTVLLSLAIASAAADDPKTHGLMNGRAWRDLSELAKTAYVLGIADGIEGSKQSVCHIVSDSRLCVGASISEHLNDFGKSTIGEIVEAMNDFYRDPANVQIPILNAMRYFQLKVRGVKPDTLAEALASMREAAASQQ